MLEYYRASLRPVAALPSLLAARDVSRYVAAIYSSDSVLHYLLSGQMVTVDKIYAALVDTIGSARRRTILKIGLSRVIIPPPIDVESISSASGHRANFRLRQKQ